MNRDKEILDQEAFESAPLSAQDKELYTLLMGELDKGPEIQVKPSFSTTILKRVLAKRKKEERWESVLFASAIGGVITLVVVMLLFINTIMSESINLLENSPLLPAILLATLLIVFQVLDKKYLVHTPIKKHLKQQ